MSERKGGRGNHSFAQFHDRKETKKRGGPAYSIIPQKGAKEKEQTALKKERKNNRINVHDQKGRGKRSQCRFLPCSEKE